MDLTLIAAGATGAAIVGAISIIIQVILNKKLRTPADEEVRAENARNWEKAAISDRNDILVQVRLQLKEAEDRADKLEARADKLGEKLEEAENRIRDVERAHSASEAAWLHWAYRAIAVIRRLGGSDSDIPKPTPGSMSLGRASHK